MTARPRAVFFGTPHFAVPYIGALADFADVVAVVSQPDKPAGRGLDIVEPPVKLEARRREIPVTQPTRLRDGTFAEWLRAQDAEFALVVAYGRILPVDVLAAPRRGCFNVHASLLPRHRGAAPINWAILAGDTHTGVTLMQMDEGMDTGPMLATRETPIAPDETAVELAARLSHLGCALVRDEVPRFLAGGVVPVAQDGANATLAPMLTREMSRIEWKKTARQVHDQVRGLQPWPCAATSFGARRLIVHCTTLDAAPALTAGAPGEVVAVTRERIWVATGSGAVALTEVQLEGKKRVAVRDFLAGHPLRAGTFLGAA